MKRLGLRYVSTDALTIRRRRTATALRLSRRAGRTINGPDHARPVETSRRAAGLRGRALRHRPARAHPGDRARCRRAAAVSLSRRLGAGARAPQGAPLQRLVEALPRIRRAVNKHLATAEPTRAFALSAVIELVACSAIRRRQRELREGERHARRRDLAQVQCRGQWRDGHAEIPRQGRQGGRQGISLPARRERDQGAARHCRAGACFSIAATTGCASSRPAT